jgi:hypothetical protein
MTLRRLNNLMSSTAEIMADLLTFEYQKSVHSYRHMETLPSPSQTEWELSEIMPDLTAEQAEAISTTLWLMADRLALPTEYLVMARRLEKFIALKQAEAQQEEDQYRANLTQAIASKQAGNYWLNQ